MHTWSPYPFLRITFALIIGIVSYHYFSDYISLEINKAYLIILSFFVLYTLIKPFFKSQDIILGNIGLVMIAIIGFVNTLLYDKSNYKNHLLYSENSINGYIAKVNSSVIEKEKYFIYNVNLEKILVGDSVIQKQASIKLYVRRTYNDTPKLIYGNRIIIKKAPFRLPPPSNPNEFNYMEYMAGQNIYYQQFLDIDDIKIISYKPDNIFIAWAINWRLYFSNKLEQYIQSKNESAIAKALILGVKDGLDNKIKSSYSSAGAMHVLAVSGLHAGIIHMILQFLFQPLIKRKTWKYVLPLISIICLWAFAMVTGLSPSIMRAVTMFSIIIVGNYYFSKPSIYNSLALSAFILLFYNPNFLFSVGFQLSYIAVAGIVYIYPLVYGVFTINHDLLDKVWSISSVSIAAQIATFPLTIYYFHQFPVYFLISNLVVIPAAFIIMCLGLILLLSEIFFLSDFIGFLLEKLISFLNAFVFYIQEMDMSLIEWIYIDKLQMVTIYGMILFSLMLIHYRKMLYMKLIAICVIIFSCSGVYSIQEQSKVKKLILYKIKGQSIIDNVIGLKSNLISVNEIDNIKLIKHQIEPFRLGNNLAPINTNLDHNLSSLNSFKGLRFLTYHKRKVVFITEKITPLDFSYPIVCDIVIISNNSVKSINDLKQKVEFKEIIIDSSNDYYTAKLLLKEAEEMKIDCRSVNNEGAIILEANESNTSVSLL